MRKLLLLLPLVACTPTPLQPPAPTAQLAPSTSPTSTVAAVPRDASAAVDPVDAGPKDAITPDAGLVDAGRPDAGAARTVRLPGACIDPKTHASKTIDKGKYPDSLYTDVPGVDLDGDGVDDAVIFGGATNITSTHHLYVLRGKCGHYVGTLHTAASGLAPTTDVNAGLFDLEGESACQRHCCTAGTRFRYRFDGRVYREQGTTPITRSCGNYPAAAP